MDEKFQILTLSGGGIRGLFTAEVLARLEQLKGINITDHFDMICGTSIGGVIALALASGEKPEHIAELLKKHGQVIFPPIYKSRLPFVNLFISPFLKTWRILKNIFNASYNPTPLKELLEEIFGDSTIKDLRTRVLIPAVNYSTGKATVFKTPHKACYKNDLHLKLVDVALATSAAPTFFPIHLMDSARYVDGGLIANSPSYFGIHEALYFLDKKRENIKLLSIGTMGTLKTASHQEKLELGFWQWKKAAIELTMSASESLQNIWAKHILDDNYLSVDEIVTNDQSPYISLDNSTDESLETLSARGKDCAKYLVNNPKFLQFLEHTAKQPDFFVKDKILEGK